MKKFTLFCWLALTAVLLAMPAGAGAVQAKAEAGPGKVGSIHVFVLTEGNPDAASQFTTLNRATVGTKPRIILEQGSSSALFRRVSVRKPLEVKGRYSAVLFLNTSGDVFDAEEQAAYETYFRAGGGFVGIGSAVETSPGWQFLTDVLGTRAAASSARRTSRTRSPTAGTTRARTCPSTGT